MKLTHRPITLGCRLALLASLLTGGGEALHAQADTPVPHFIAHQGELTGADANYTGTGHFKFALVTKSTPVTAYWRNDNNTIAGAGQAVAEPATPMTLSVTQGTYGVFLGYSKALPNMGVPYEVFTRPGLRVRTWFRKGATGSFTLLPDSEIPAAGYAMQIPDGSITSTKIAANQVTSAHIANNAIGAGKIAAGAVSALNFTPTAISSSLGVGSPTSGQVLSNDGTGLKWVAPGKGDGIWSLNATTKDASYVAGNVAIGAAKADAGYRLHVVGNTQFSTPTGNDVRFGTPNGETGLSIVHEPRITLDRTIPGGRADLRFDGKTVKLVATKFASALDIANGTVPSANGVAIDMAGNVGIGTTTPLARLDVNGATRTKMLTITGGADLAEPFPMKESEIEKGAVVVIDEEHPGRLKRSASAYDTRVAGIVSGANGINPGIALYQEGALEGGQHVALSGRVYVQADASTGSIQPGDLLTTSATPGHAMKVSESHRAQGAVIGKAMSSLSEGTGLVLVLVSLQ
jgi:hypothetical protein